MLCSLLSLGGERTMQISFETFDNNPDYKSLLVINSDKMWSETAYFTFYKPWGGDEEKLYAGRYMADVHHKNKPCECVVVFDFHRWDAETIKSAMQLDVPPTDFSKNLQELLETALDKRSSTDDTFKMKVK
jgi:hypothetical protein